MQIIVLLQYHHYSLSKERHFFKALDFKLNAEVILKMAQKLTEGLCLKDSENAYG